MSQPIDAKTFTELKAAMGDDFIGELVETYLAETPGLITSLHQSLVQGDMETFRRTAHTLKSTSASFGALDFAAQARELEALAKGGALVQIPPLLQALTHAYPEVEGSLKSML